MATLKATVIDVTKSTFQGKRQAVLKVNFSNSESGWDVDRIVFLDLERPENEKLIIGVELAVREEKAFTPRSGGSDRNSGGNRSGGSYNKR